MRRVRFVGVAMVLIALTAAPSAAARSWQIQPSANGTGAKASRLVAVSCTSAPACTAVGNYINSTGIQVTLAERSNGANWSVQTTPPVVGAKSSELSGVACTSATSCTAVGSYTNGTGTRLTLAEHWNGTSWAIQTTPNPTGATSSQLNGISCPSASVCEAVGISTIGGSQTTLAENLTGTTWTTQTTPNRAGATSSQLNGISCTASTACIAVGSSTIAGTQTTLAENLASTTWTIQTTPNPVGATSSWLNGVSCAAATACVAVGASTSGGTQTTLAEVLSGSSWTIPSTPNPTGATSSQFNGISCRAANICEAIGGYTKGTGLTLAESLVGAGWSIEPSATVATATGSVLSGVSCTNTTACAAVGDYVNSTATDVTLAELLQPTWAVQSTVSVTGAQNTSLYGVSCPALNACIAVGTYNSGSGPRPMGESWNGTKWTRMTVPSPASATRSTLEAVSCTSSTACTAVGSWTDSTSMTFAFAERLTGTQWLMQLPPNPAGATNTHLAGVSCNSSTLCTAVGGANGPSGGTLVEVWNGGSTWSIQTTPNPPGASGADFTSTWCTTGATCSAVGFSQDTSGNITSLAEGQSGTIWSVQNTPNPVGSVRTELDGVACDAANNCTAVGYAIVNAGRNYVTVAEHWDGTSWTLQPSPNPLGAQYTYLNGAACPSATSCTAVGGSSGKGFDVAAVEGSNGSGWTLQRTPSPAGTKGTVLNAISCTSPTVCTAVGDYVTGTTNTTVTLAERSS